MNNPSEQYRASAAALTELAAVLEAGETSGSAALGVALDHVEGLVAVEPHPGTRGALVDLVDRLRSVGTIDPSKLREMAVAQINVAQGHDDLQSGLNNLWS